jgi:NTP pyrophosphatase (non-canonical NTP hydrolase)
VNGAFGRIARDVRLERDVQEEGGRERRAAGQTEWRSCADPELDDGTRLAILVEEVGEVAHALNERRVGNVEDLRAELVQVAAVAFAWVEAIDSERAQ